MHRVLEVKNQFDFISFTHTYKELNSKEHLLSKDALSLQEGSLEAQDFMGEELCVESFASFF